MSRILVSGGLGYIGSHTVTELLEAGYQVVIVDNLMNSSLSMLDGIKAITGKDPDFHNLDLRDKDAVDTFFQNERIDGLIHFAASKAVGESVENPLLYYENNISSLVYLLQNCARHGIKNIIFSSSCTVYGEPDELPITEDAPVKPANSPYGNTKQIGEEILRDSCAAYGLKTISLRYFNPIGAHPSALIGELPLGVPQNLVPFITQTAMGIREELSVYGNDYPTPDGSCIRDYIHVVDLANAHMVALERLLGQKQQKDFEVYNVGTGKGCSVLEVIEAFEAVSGKPLKYRITDRRAGDVISVYADTQLAENELGWKARRSLEDALLSAWKWEQYYRNSQL